MEIESRSCVGPAWRGRWLLALVLLLALGTNGCVGGSGEPAATESAPASALRQRFPERAALVLEQGEPFVATAEGFALERPSGRGGWQGADVTLPRDGREAIRFRGFGGVEVRVMEVGAHGEGVPAEHAVTYRRSGGTSFWTASAGGVEEWLHLEGGAVQAGDVVATWEVDGAMVRQHGEGVEVVDAGGVVRLSVTAPVAYAAGGREVGARLVASGARIELQVDAVGEAVLVDPMWVTVAPMSQARSEHTATLLPNGKVLVTGGYGGSLLSSAELYDRASNTWSAVPPMSQGRSLHTATLLGNGEVLIAGGSMGNFNLASAELYEPATNTWSAAPPMSQARCEHTATVLPNGKVLVAGVSNSAVNAELYDPATNSWSQTGLMSNDRSQHTATRLGSGDVLVVGGDGITAATAEVYDPTTGNWSQTGLISHYRYQSTATLLGSGNVVVAGGGSNVASAELYDPATSTWSPAGAMIHGRSLHTATLLGSGNVLATGGYYVSSYLAGAELYNPATNTWSLAPPMSQARSAHTATLLGSGEVLVAGGFSGSVHLASAELYTLVPLGSACTLAGDCQSGFCVDGVCCNTACNAGACEACSTAAGALVNGTCASLTGPVCNDGDACTQSDACQAGACVGANPVVCPPPDQCHTGVCNPATGACSSPAKANGTACADGDPCTQSDTCQAGVCTGGPTVICAPPDQCHTVSGACDPVKGCPSTAKPDGAVCNDGDLCTQSDTCQAGVCTGSKAVVCKALDSCHVPGQCDPATGVCTNLAKPDTAACDDGDACTQTDTCLGGVCKGANPVGCEAMDECHGAGSCDPSTGMCSTPAKPDGAPCPGGTCNAGVCASAPDGGSGSSSSGVSSTSSSSSSTGGGAGMNRGCGCGVVGAPDLHPAWLGLGLLLARRRRARRASSRRVGQVRGSGPSDPAAELAAWFAQLSARGLSSPAAPRRRSAVKASSRALD